MAPPGTAAVRAADQHTSVRARSKPKHDPADPQRKTVYKPVLDNPLSVQWPPLPASVRKAILDELLALLASATTASGKSIADWRLDEHALRRGNKRGAGKGKGKGKAREEGVHGTEESQEKGRKAARVGGKEGDAPIHTLTTRSSSTYAIPTSVSQTSSSSGPAEPAPALLSHLVVGINEVTRALETRIRWGRWELGERSAAPSSAPAAPAAVEERKGRHRRRKPSFTAAAAVIPASSPRAPQPLPLADHPAYAFLHARAPRPAKGACPPYVVSPALGREGEDGPVRLLVNSDARRVKALPPRAALVPTQPPPAPESEDDEGEPTTAGEPQEPAAPVEPAAAPTVPLIDLVLVCKPDINPPSLVAHLPTMVAAANGVQAALDGVLAGEAGREDAAKEAGKMEVDEPAKESGGRPEMRKVLLVPLDVGAERTLADALGLRRVAAIGLSSLSPATAPLLALIASQIPAPLSAPWLVPHVLHPPRLAPPSSRFAPTAIKHLKTSAPLNPRAAITLKKEDRRKGKDEKRRKRRLDEGGDGDDGEGDRSVYVAED
ncbi:RNase P and RNase MRP subunit [Rhodotorula kratochvilovae]